MASSLPQYEDRTSIDHDFLDVLAVFLPAPADKLTPGFYTLYRSYYLRTWEGLYAIPISEISLLGRVNSTHIKYIVYQARSLGKWCTRPQLRSAIRQSDLFRGRTDEQVNRMIDLALRLWLAILVRDLVYAPHCSVQWNDEVTLGNLITSQFAVPRNANTVTQRVDGMTMVRLRRYSGIQVEWTDNLREHLSFNVSARRVKIFRLKFYINQMLVIRFRQQQSSFAKLQ